jgi:uncharacterized membrane protein YphA (DoxX/SURF4 family)
VTAVGDALEEVVDRRVSMRTVGLLRALMGVVVVRHLWPEVTASPVAVDRFHVVWWSWLPVPDPGTYRLLGWLGVAAGAAMVVGLASRIAVPVALAVVSYLLFLDMTGFAHNRAFLVWLLVGLCLLPTGRAFAVDALRRRAPPPDRGPYWPVFMLRVVVASVYFTSGFTKLLDADWRSGLVLWDRVNRFEQLIPFDGWVHDVVTSRAFHHVLSPSAIALELFLAVGLWHPRTRVAAIWVALVFHSSIEIAASVQTFSYSAIAALLLWVTPVTGDRTLMAGPEWLQAAVARLDWFDRFRPAEHAATPAVGPAVVVDRNGRMLHGREATLLVLSRLPLLFPVAGPALALHRLRSGAAGSQAPPASRAVAGVDR